MRATIKDIAEKTGLSHTTVSLVLNGKGQRMSLATRELIFKVAKELNYRPNRLAIGLSTNKTKTIGVVVPDVSNPFFASLVKKIDDACHEAGYQILLCNSNDRSENDLNLINMLLDYGVDGLILALASASDNLVIQEKIQSMQNSGVPLVLVDRLIFGVDSWSVKLDYQHGAYLATQHLLEMGHRKIGLISGPLSMLSSALRVEGYKQALTDYGVAIDEGLIQEGNFHYEDGLRLSANLIDSGVSAIFALNDIMAYGVYSYARDNNISIPEDLSVVGFDNLFTSRILTVSLTTIDQPIDQLALKSTELVLKQIEEPSADIEHVMFKPELIVGDSVRKVK